LPARAPRHPYERGRPPAGTSTPVCGHPLADAKPPADRLLEMPGRIE